MSIDFFASKCQDQTDQKLFGLCDDIPHHRAYMGFTNGEKWIAVVNNYYCYNVTFTAIDNCIEIKRADGKMEQRCEGFLSYNDTIIFIELKERDVKGNDWVKEAEEQLRTSIHYFEHTDEAAIFKHSQMRRMQDFFQSTGYILRIENRIALYG